MLYLTVSTSFQDREIDKELRVMTRGNEAFFQAQCDLYKTFLIDYITEYRHIDFHISKLFVNEDIHSRELTERGKNQAFYLFEVCYEVFLDILRYRLTHFKKKTIFSLFK